MEKRDYYEVLGVAKNASADAIRTNVHAMTNSAMPA